VQRRTFLARTFAGPLTLARLAYAQRDSSTFGKSRASVRFETGQIDVAGNKIFIAVVDKDRQSFRFMGFRARA
jgi:hypothetical protein